MVLMNSAALPLTIFLYFAHRQTRAVSQKLTYRPNYSAISIQYEKFYHLHRKTPEEVSASSGVRNTVLCTQAIRRRALVPAVRGILGQSGACDFPQDPARAQF